MKMFNAFEKVSSKGRKYLAVVPLVASVSMLGISAGASAAISENVSIGELIDFVSKSGKNNIENYAASVLLENLADTEYAIQSGELVSVVKLEDSSKGEIKSICTKYKYSDIVQKVTVDRSTKFNLSATEIDKPIKLKAKADVTAKITGRVQIEKGHEVFGPFLGGGGCVYTGITKVSSRIEASVTGSGDFSVSVNLNPKKIQLSDSKVRYQISPTLTTKGKITDIGKPRFRAVSGGIAGKVISKIDDLIFNATEKLAWDLSLTSVLVEKYVDDKYLQDIIEERNEEFTKKLAQKVLGSDYQNWTYGDPIVRNFDMPTYASVALEDAIEFVSEGISNYEYRFPISYEFLQQDDIQEDLFDAIIAGDNATVATLLGSSLACEAAMNSVRPMKVASTSVYTETVSPAEYCASLIGENSKNLGNASDVIKSDWMLSPGTTLDIGAKSIRENYQPYMQRVRYKTVRSKVSGQVNQGQQCWYDSEGRIQYCSDRYVNTYYGDGQCELEMRVYKKNPTQKGLKPIMAIHGGSWKYRGFGFFGLESMVSHLTDRGYVVFAPFYRLAGNSDGNAECNRANGKDIVADAQDALEWVVDNAGSYGASGKVALFGQSAGAHLAAYLSVHEKSSIDRAWLMYPPTHMADYIKNWSPDMNPAGTGAVEGFLSHLRFDDLSDLVGSTDTFIKDVSFPDIIDNSPSSYPPVFVIHGLADDLVPSRQAELLCSAYGGSGTYSATNTGGYRGVNQCGSRGSRLHLIKEAGHILDLGCINRDLAGGKLCPAGSYESERAIEKSIDDAIAWLAADLTPSTGGSSSSSGPRVYFSGECYGQGCQGPGSTCHYDYSGTLVFPNGTNYYECRSK